MPLNRRCLHCTNVRYWIQDIGKPENEGVKIRVIRLFELTIKHFPMYICRRALTCCLALSLFTTVPNCLYKHDNLLSICHPNGNNQLEFAYLETCMRENQINMQTKSFGLYESPTLKRYHKRVCEMGERTVEFPQRISLHDTPTFPCFIERNRLAIYYNFCCSFFPLNVP